DGLPMFSSSKTGFENILVGFRSLLRQIGEETASYRSAIASVSEHATLAQAGALQDTTIIDEVDETASADASEMRALLEKLFDAVEALKPTMASVPEEPQTAIVVDDKNIDHLEHFSADKTPMHTILVSFRVLLRSIEAESKRLNNAVTVLEADNLASPMPAAVAQLERSVEEMKAFDGRFETLFSNLETRLADAVGARVDTVSDAVGATLAGVEERLAASLDVVTSGMSDSRALLEGIRDTIGKTKSAPVSLFSGGGGSSAPSAAAAVNLMSAFASSIEARFGNMDQSMGALQAVIDGSDLAAMQGDAKGEFEALVFQMQEAAESIREQTSEFLAIGAAVSADLEKTQPHAPKARIAAHR
ncbi:MAG: hypothetical protein AAFW47_04600, partial [Pseudomonadota bacterium]